MALSSLRVGYFSAHRMLRADASMEDIAHALERWNPNGCMYDADIFFGSGLLASTVDLLKLSSGTISVNVPQSCRLTSGFYSGPFVVACDRSRIQASDEECEVLMLPDDHLIGRVRWTFGTRTATTFCLHLQNAPKCGVLPYPVDSNSSGFSIITTR